MQRVGLSLRRILGNAIDLALQAGYKIINKVGDEGRIEKKMDSIH